VFLATTAIIRFSPGETVGKMFSLRNLCVLSVSALSFTPKMNHRRDAEVAEGAQSSFSDRLRRGEAPAQVEDRP
jgi:hypothetical protein